MKENKKFVLKTSNSCYNTIIRWTEVDVDKRRELYSDVVRLLKSTSYIFRNNLGRNISISMIGKNDGIIVTCRNADTAVAIRSDIERMFNNFRVFLSSIYI